MNLKCLILTLSFALGAHAAWAAGEPATVRAAPAAAGASAAIPRVVVTATREQARALALADEAPVPRVVVTAPRQTAGGTAAALPKSAVGGRF